MYALFCSELDSSYVICMILYNCFILVKEFEELASPAVALRPDIS